MMDFCPKKGKFFIFILGQYFSFFFIFVLSHIWLPRYEKTADFLAQMLFGSCIGSHWFQKLKNIQSDTQYLCKIPDIFSVSQPKCLLLTNFNPKLNSFQKIPEFQDFWQVFQILNQKTPNYDHFWDKNWEKYYILTKLPISRHS